jgi:aspartate-semialdehyde dehydrogenase
MRKYNVAVVGATGLVGSTFLKVLKEYDFPIKNLTLFASERSAGKKVIYDGKEYIVQDGDIMHFRFNV